MNIKKQLFIEIIFFICVLLGLCLSLGLSPFYYLWDSANLFRFIDSADIHTLYHPAELSFANHISHSFSIALIIFKLIFRSTLTGMRIFSLLLYLLSIYGMYRWLSLLSIENSFGKNLFLTLCWALSPYLMGMVTYTYHDYAIWCLIPLVTYELQARHFWRGWAAALFFIFIKETAVVSYGGLLVGFFVLDIFKQKEKKLSVRPYLIWGSPLFLWLYCYFFQTHWDGVGGFGVDAGYITMKSKSLLLVNFNWLLLVVTIFFFVVMLRKTKKISLFYSIFPTVLSGLCFFVFSIFFQTVCHFRYIDALAGQLYMLFLATLSAIGFRKKIFAVITSGLILLLTISCFYTVDPLMLATMKRLSVGNRTIVYPELPLSDSWVYNRQYQGFGHVCDMAIRDILDQGSSVVIMPLYQNNTWYFDALGYWVTTDEGHSYVNLEELWNARTGSRMTSFSDKNNRTIYIMHVSDSEDIISNWNTGHYLYTDYAGENIAQELMHHFPNVQITDYQYRGWLLHCLTF